MFEPKEFLPVVMKYGKGLNSSTCILRRLYKSGLLYIAKETRNKTGGEPIKTYAVVEGAKFKITLNSGRPDHREQAKIKEIKIHNCSKNLESVMNNWI